MWTCGLVFDNTAAEGGSGDEAAELPRPARTNAIAIGPRSDAHVALGGYCLVQNAQHAYPFFGLLSSRLKCDWVPWIACHFSRLLHEHRKRGFLKHFRQSELHVHLK